MKRKSGDGVFFKRGESGEVIYFYRLGKNKSKDFFDKRKCAEEFVEKFVQHNPKYEPLCAGKTWEQCFKLFNIDIGNRY